MVRIEKMVKRKCVISVSYENTIGENLRFGITETLILRLLSEEDKYVYQIAQELDARTNGSFSFKAVALYLPLYRLVERGLVDERREIVVGKRFRRYYHLNESGATYYEAVKKEYRNMADGVDAIMAWEE